MENPIREELNVADQRAVLAGVFDPDECNDRDTALDELKGLVKTAGVTVVGEIVQFRDTPHPAHCLGTGKLDELKLLVETTDAEMVVFDNNLTPSQGRALEQAVNCLPFSEAQMKGTVIFHRADLVAPLTAAAAVFHKSPFLVYRCSVATENS
ncbi:MAG: hypothetical protein GY826_25540, partial [Fuerstiella sp.]|nr:hypothetical protein [Fuerstiella sp.]